MLGSGGGEVRRYERAFSWLSASIEFARSHDHDSTAAYDQAWQARIRFEQGRWDEAADLARDPAAAPQPARISPSDGARCARPGCASAVVIRMQRNRYGSH